jgi:cell division protein FtsW (lipid II flippase)
VRSRELWLLLIAPFATCVLGVVVLHLHGVELPRLVLMIAALPAAVIVAMSLATRGRALLERWAPALAVMSLALLAASLADRGLLGVHRWIALGPIRLHVSALVCPFVLATAATLLSHRRVVWAAATLVVAQTLHAVQPDAAQSTALALGAAAGLCLWPMRPIARAAAIVVVALSVVPAWMSPDPLAPVAEVEGIVGLAADLGAPVHALAVVLLALLPTTLAIAAMRGQCESTDPVGRDVARASCIALAGYVAGTVIAPMLGDFPVPVLGFGVSPVLGVGACVGLSVAHRVPRGTPEPCDAPA